ncbi:MAG: Holliday junction resolvase RuvX [Fimbriimonadaceae bacterium]
MSRVIGVDFGSKRIGIAVGVTEFRIASPRNSILAAGKLSTDATAIALIAKTEEASLVVVGVPENEQDQRMANVCVKLAQEIRLLGLDVETVDESFTSVEAISEMRELKGSDKRKRKDGEAACRIIERYWDEQDLA